MQWLQDTLAELGQQLLLDPGQMLSASLYDKTQIEAVLSHRQTALLNLKNESMLGRILAFEMAYHSVWKV